jgi:hypothetical protein
MLYFGAGNIGNYDNCSFSSKEQELSEQSIIL